MKVIILLALLAIIAALASAGAFMLRKSDATGGDKKMARALAVRVGLSIALFLFILLANQLGWIQPSGLR